MGSVAKQGKFSPSDRGGLTRDPPLDVSPTHLLHTPLPQLLTELDVELHLLPIDDETVCGVTEVRDGRISLQLSSRWPAPLRELMARSMLGTALRIELPPLPEPFAVTEV